MAGIAGLGSVADYEKSIKEKKVFVRERIPFIKIFLEKSRLFISR